MACGSTGNPPLLQIFILLLLIGLSNSAPIAAKKIFGARFGRPLDGGIVLSDGAPLFGHSKTLRGVLVGMLIPALAAPVAGIPWWQGLAIGTAAMAGDLLSSFIKRRRGLAPSSQALGLDHIPESLLPALLATIWFDLGMVQILALVVAFVVLSLLLSKLLYHLDLRDQPY